MSIPLHGEYVMEIVMAQAQMAVEETRFQDQVYPDREKSFKLLNIKIGINW
jgi:hypothetical protein